jgi:hypothetical protein
MKMEKQDQIIAVLVSLLFNVNWIFFSIMELIENDTLEWVSIKYQMAHKLTSFSKLLNEIKILVKWIILLPVHAAMHFSTIIVFIHTVFY